MEFDHKYRFEAGMCPNLINNRKDWEIESSKMGSIYANSHITIAAAKASNDQFGFLQPRARFISHDVHWPVSSTLIAEFKVRNMPNIYRQYQEDPLTKRLGFARETFGKEALDFLGRNRLGA